jgi:hypothetical protein
MLLHGREQGHKARWFWIIDLARPLPPLHSLLFARRRAALRHFPDKIGADRLLLVYFRGVHARFVREGALLGGVWLAINWGLDAAVLLPLSGMDAGTYMAQIGLRYLIIPIIAVGIGAAVEQGVGGSG